MKQNNPMASVKTVAKMMRTKEANGTLRVWKGERGGNGKLTAQEQRLLKALGRGWKSPQPVSLIPRPVGFPTNYKLDVGNKELKVGVEIDGRGHQLKRQQALDRKKQRKLESLGWMVLRFSNNEIDNDLTAVLKKIRSSIAWK